MMRAVSVLFVETVALVHAEKHFLMKTPMRWQLIAEYVLKCIPVLSGKPDAGHSPDAAPIPLMVLALPLLLNFGLLQRCAGMHFQ